MALSVEDLRRLQVDLRSDDPLVRSDAVRCAAAAIDATVMDIVSQALLSENPEVRERAVALIDRLAEMSTSAGEPTAGE